jgi:hypothetical protein
MILEGVLDNSLGNFICLRGFAPMGDLHQISKPDPSYQRDLIKSHHKEMVDFLDSQEFLFFPEVILATSLVTGELGILNYGNSEKLNKFNEKIYKSESYKESFDYFELSYSVSKRKGREDIRSEVLFRRAKLIIKEGSLKEYPAFSPFKKFHRIDGNHRLSILDEKTNLAEGFYEKFKNYNVPFCLVLFRNEEELAKNSRALFHNINYKQIPLTKEQSLKLILDDEVLFPDNRLSDNKSFGIEYFQARNTLKTWDLEIISNINEIICPFGDDPFTPEKRFSKRTFLVDAYKLLAQNKIKTNVRLFKENLAKVNQFYENQKLRAENKNDKEYIHKQRNYGLLTAYVYYAHLSEAKLKMFNNWVLENHIYKSEDNRAEELIKIFNQILEAKRRTIFISMPFCNETKKTFRNIQNVINSINQECEADLHLKILRIDELNKGVSHKIDEQILIEIEDAGLLIADLSLGNKNVYHEVGYLMGLIKAGNLRDKGFILIHNSEVKKSNFDKDIGFNIKTYKVLKSSKDSDPKTFEEAIKNHIKEFYKFPLN